ncbi:lysosomal protective protein-like [Amphiura filiformis]|uniref:lysosomal protective protein-like n=1 Tax=Amphiura filiformis TaxID=82378 RepID=UPI003B211C81
MIIIKMKIQLLLFACIIAVPSTRSATDPDLISWLPGLVKQPSFNQYAGYLNASVNNKLHYWFVESQDSPKTDPLLIWFNGGPACSSLFGLLSENGPFLVNDDGVNLSYNPYSWNMKASVLYIESPPGTGFSYTVDGKLPSSDDQVTEDHYAAIMDFFSKHPTLLLPPLFLVGQSYAGVYLPLLAVKLQDVQGLNFQGLAVGSPCSNLKDLDNSLIYYAYHHGIFSQQLWTDLNKHCCNAEGTCNFHDNNKTSCVNSVGQAFYMINEIGINPFNIYQDCAGGIPPPGKFHKKSPDGRYYYPGVFRHMYSKNPKLESWWKVLDQTPVNKLIVGIPCVNTSAITSYLNNPYVKQALHVKDGLKDWKPYNPEVDQNFTRQYPDMSPTFLQILRTYKYRILVYSGDCDAVCNFLGNEWMVNNFGLEEEVQWRPWLYNPGTSDQIAGFVKEFSHIAFVTVKGAGHYAPADRPGAMQQLIYNFINKRPF